MLKHWALRGILAATVLSLWLGAGCERQAAAPALVPPPSHGASSSSIGAELPPPGQFWRYSYQVVNTFPHDRKAFTQGLVFLDGKLLESTGLNGQSTLREVNLVTGEVQRQVAVPDQYFAEGLTVLGGKAYQLTWQAHKGFIYDEATFRQQGEFAYDGEGWGLATDGQSLILSDGTPQIRFLDPVTFKVGRTIQVTFQGRPVAQLNELEYVHGEIFANVWQTDYVLRINPDSGAVTGVIDFTGLLPPADRDPSPDAVLNGIAYDAASDRLFITGKLWPKLFEVRLKRVPSSG